LFALIAGFSRPPSSGDEKMPISERRVNAFPRENAPRSPTIARMKLADIRQEYMRAGLSEADAEGDALRQFERWLREAIEAGVPLPNAMTLATVGERGAPSARVVLLKGVERGGFVFFTNYLSRKGRELERRAEACLVFLWAELERQVRVEGRVEKGHRGGVGRLLRHPPARRAPFRLGLPPERDGPLEEKPRRQGPGDAAPARRRPPATAALGRLPRGSGDGRVLAGARRPAARPPSLRAHRRWMVRLTPRSLTKSFSF
jgi:hypothetical protein